MAITDDGMNMQGQGYQGQAKVHPTKQIAYTFLNLHNF